MIYMDATQFYDSKNLGGSVLIWVHDSEYDTFTVNCTNPGGLSMSVSGYPLFNYRQSDYFFKTNNDIPKFYILKEEYVS